MLTLTMLTSTCPGDVCLFRFIIAFVLTFANRCKMPTLVRIPMASQSQSFNQDFDEMSGEHHRMWDSLKGGCKRKVPMVLSHLLFDYRLNCNRDKLRYRTVHFGTINSQKKTFIRKLR